MIHLNAGDVTAATQTVFRASAHGPICPHCDRLNPKNEHGDRCGSVPCAHCHKLFSWKVIPTQAGQSWSTTASVRK